MTELSWNNTHGLHIHALHWPAEHPRAAIALVHGQGEHIGRYKHVGEWFSAHGVAVLGCDLQGYGRSAGKKGHAPNLDALLDDIGRLLAETRERHPDIPIFLYGHSMGGQLALNFVLRRQPKDLAGIIITSPWIRLAFEPPGAKVMAARLLRRFMPTLTLPTNLAAHFISRDPEVVQAYKTDPLVHGLLSAAGGMALIEGAAYLDHYAGTLPAPLLLMHGGDDRITSSAATSRFASRLTGDVTHKEWPGLYHEMHNEKEQETVFDFTLDWIDAKI